MQLVVWTPKHNYITVIESQIAARNYTKGAPKKNRSDWEIRRRGVKMIILSGCYSSIGI